MPVRDEEVLLGVSWADSPDGWAATLLTAADGERIERPLHPGTELEFEVTGTRRCTGFGTGSGHRLCPDQAVIGEGSQCHPCRERDAHRDYVEGRTGDTRDGDHSVYLAQCGSRVTPTLTRSGRLLNRWVEQGAAFAVEVESGVGATEALAREAALSDAGLTERIRKEAKLPVPDDHRLGPVLAEHGATGDVVDVQARTAYRRPTASTVQREGRVAGEVRSVLGGLIEVSGQCFAVTPGRCLSPARQTGLRDFL